MYKRIYFDISGVCNAHCRYCVSGKDSISGSEHRKQGKFIDIETFSGAITHMLSKKIIAPDCEVILYSWGEPFLHKDLKMIIDILNRNELFYSLSTNASICISFNEEQISRLKNITFSMPGFSQDSYDRIHGFKFDRIKNNISDMVLSLRSSRYTGPINLAYHIYKFNLHEISLAANFAKEVCINFVPSLAYLNGYNMFRHFLTKAMKPNQIEVISTEVFTEHLGKMQRQRPTDYICPQFERLSIDESCNVLMCCGMEKTCGDRGLVGDLFKMDFNDIQERKRDMTICDECTSLAIDYIGHNAIGIVDFLRLYGELFSIVDYDSNEKQMGGDIYVYGTGETADALFGSFLNNKLFNVNGVIHGQSVEKNIFFRGHKVENIDVLKNNPSQKVLIASLSSKSIDEIYHMLRREFKITNPIIKFEINI